MSTRKSISGSSLRHLVKKYQLTSLVNTYKMIYCKRLFLLFTNISKRSMQLKYIHYIIKYTSAALYHAKPLQQ